MTMAGETIEELRTRENNPFLKVISATELDKMLRLFYQSLSEPFREITEEDYYDLLDVLPPLRMRQKTRSLWVNRTTGACTLLCFTREGRYFKGLRSIQTPTIRTGPSDRPSYGSHQPKGNNLQRRKGREKR